MTKELIWRLGKLPTPQEVSTLINDKVITKDEARDILFRTEEVEEEKPEDLKAQVKFLKEVIEKLSNKDYTRVKEIIVEYKPSYSGVYWYGPYNGWATTCQGASGLVITGGNSTTTGVSTYATVTSNGNWNGGTSTANATNCAFTSIS